MDDLAVADEFDGARQRRLGLQSQSSGIDNLAPQRESLVAALRVKDEAAWIAEPIERDVGPTGAQCVPNLGFALFGEEQMRADVAKAAFVRIEVDVQQHVARLFSRDQSK